MKTRYLSAIALFLGASATLLSHPHLNKMVKATLPNKVEASIAYYTVPANMEHVKKVQVGDFVPSRAVLSLSGGTASGSTAIQAGDYTIGAIRNAGDWTLALYPGKPARGMMPDKSKVIRLDSSFSDSEGTAHHVSFDLAPGHGKLEGKTTVIWHFGNLYVAGALQ